MLRSLDAVVDVMHVPASGDAGAAVRTVPALALARDQDCDILVVGGGTGGVAAALAAARAGRQVVLLEETDWLGGQLTSQGVSALDEHEYIETFGGTASYMELREMLRNYYCAQSDEAGRYPAFNPGQCWVTRLAFEPRAALQVLERMLQPHVLSGHLTVYLRSKAVAAEVQGDLIVAVVAMDLDDASLIRFRPQLVIDSTELGDVLPLCGAEHVVGAETSAETGEPQAQPLEPKLHCVQSCTYTFACELRDEGENHVIPRPERFGHYCITQPYTLRIEVHGGEIYGESSGWLDYSIFDTLPGTKGGLWTYRRLLDRSLFQGSVAHDLTMFNWPSNDYRDCSLLQGSAHDLARALQDAKRVSLGFLHWLQTEAPASRSRLGAPEIRLRPDVMGSADGLSKFPYIRESRRIRALKTIVEQEVSADHQPGPRAAFFSDSVGVGWYPIDIHRSGPDDVGASCRTRPFQIPLGALLPLRVGNLIAGAKNIGTTHITNGCFRLHPIEWNVGEAAGTLAAMAMELGVAPVAVHRDADLMRRLQRRLLEAGVPIAWLIDVGNDDPLFVGSQLLFMRGALATGTDLRFDPAAALSPQEWQQSGGTGPVPPTRGEAARRWSERALVP